MKKLLILLISILIFNCSSDDSNNDNVVPQNNCSSPVGLDVYNITNTTATFGFGTSIQSSLFEIEYGEFGFTLGNGILITSPTTFVDIENLSPSTQYTFYVRQYCNTTNSFSDWVNYSFVTLDYNPYCDDPTNITPTNIGATFIELTWSNGSFEGHNLEFGPVNFVLGNGTVISSNNGNNNTVDGLQPETTYDFYVQNNCGSEGVSGWTGPITVTTDEADQNPNCLDPSNFRLLSTGSNDGEYVDLAWDANNGETSWTIHFVLTGQGIGSTNNYVDISFNPVRMRNYLNTGTTYDFYVRANCGGTNGVSGWSNPVTVTGP